jgi:hypothetical protein
MAAEIVVRPSVVADVYRLAASLRDSNRDEIVDLGLDPRVALRANFRMAMLRRTYLVDGEVAAMTGLCGSLLGDIGFPYLMTAPPVERVPVAFLKLARRGVADMLEHKMRLEGYVAANYRSGCRFLQALGFTLGDAKPFGAKGALFRSFVMVR